jgi:hypothetical protein
MPNNLKFLKAKKQFPSLYGNIAFPTRTNFFGSVSAILRATRSEQKVNALSFWFWNLVRELGLQEAIEERDRTLIRGRNIDYTMEKMFADITAPTYSAISASSDFRLDKRVVEHWKTNGLDVLATELPVWSYAMQFKGRLDVLADDGEFLYIIDNKGSNKHKSLAEQEDDFAQVVAYRKALKEMFRNRKKCAYTNKLLSFLPSIPAKRLSSFKCRIVYFLDGEGAPEIVELSDDCGDYRRNSKFVLRQFKERVRQFYTFPIVIIDQTEGFWRSRWKRLPKKDILQPEEFKAIIARRTSEVASPAIRFPNYFNNRLLK